MRLAGLTRSSTLVVHTMRARIPAGLPNVESTGMNSTSSASGWCQAEWLDWQHASRPFDAVVTLYEPAGPVTPVLAAHLGLRGVPQRPRNLPDKYRSVRRSPCGCSTLPGYRGVDPVEELGAQ